MTETDWKARAEAAEAELSRLTAPLEGAKTTEEERADFRRSAEMQAEWDEMLIVGPHLMCLLLDDLTHATAAAVRAAREENEACAAMADEWAEWHAKRGHDGEAEAFRLAAANIRARYPKGEE